jgi:hypothetical protein
MPTEQKTAGLLPRPVWLVVRPDGEDQCRALGPFRTLERLTGAIEGIMWASPGDDVSGYAGEVPNDCEEINIELGDEDRKIFGLQKLEAITFEQNIVEMAYFDGREGCWDRDKEWNGDTLQVLGQMLEEYGLVYPGDDAPKPVWYTSETT